MKIIDDLKRWKYVREGYETKFVIRLYMDIYDYNFSLLPSVVWKPWTSRRMHSDYIIDIWWLNIHLFIGRWSISYRV